MPTTLSGRCRTEPTIGTVGLVIVAKTGVARTSLYRHVPPRPPEPLTADGGQGEQRDVAG